MDTEQWQQMVTRVGRESWDVVKATLLQAIDEGLIDPIVVILDLRDGAARTLAKGMFRQTDTEIERYCEEQLAADRLPTTCFTLSAEEFQRMFAGGFPVAAKAAAAAKHPDVVPVAIFTEDTLSVAGMRKSELGVSEDMTPKEKQKLRAELDVEWPKPDEVKPLKKKPWWRP